MIRAGTSPLPFRGGAARLGLAPPITWASLSRSGVGRLPHALRPDDSPHPNPSPEGEGLSWLRFLLAVFLLAFSLPATAQDLLPPAPYAYKQLADPAQEAKALALMETLRCLKCQSQSIADSDAPMAGDMRHQVRERIAAGEQPEAIRQWLIERYGDYVTYTPQVRPLTAPLFAAPVVFLLVAGLLLRRRFRKTKAAKP